MAFAKTTHPPSNGSGIISPVDLGDLHVSDRADLIVIRCLSTPRPFLYLYSEMLALD
jgi:hypothetical protein